MSRLIFFSGGVESTALLNLADPVEDVLVTILPTFPRDLITSKLQSAQAIANRFGFTINYAQIKLPVEPEPYNFVHQVRTFLSVANLWVAKYPKITELWVGRCLEDASPHVNIISAWNVLYPNIPWTRPLEHLSKWDQWQSIPADVQPWVSSCVLNNNCGECYKCVQFQKLITQHD